MAIACVRDSYLNWKWKVWILEAPACVFSEHVISTAALAYRATGLITCVVFFYQLSRRFSRLFSCLFLFLSLSLSLPLSAFLPALYENAYLPCMQSPSRISGSSTLPPTSATRIARLNVRVSLPFLPREDYHPFPPLQPTSDDSRDYHSTDLLYTFIGRVR